MNRGKRGGAERQVATLEDLARHVIDSCNSCRTEKRGDEVTRNLPVGYERMSERYDIRVEGREDVIERLCRFTRGEVARHPEVGDAVTRDTITRQAQIQPDCERDSEGKQQCRALGAVLDPMRKPARAPGSFATGLPRHWHILFARARRSNRARAWQRRKVG